MPLQIKYGGNTDEADFRCFHLHYFETFLRRGGIYVVALVNLELIL